MHPTSILREHQSPISTAVKLAVHRGARKKMKTKTKTTQIENKEPSIHVTQDLHLVSVRRIEIAGEIESEKPKEVQNRNQLIFFHPLAWIFSPAFRLLGLLFSAFTDSQVKS